AAWLLAMHCRSHASHASMNWSDTRRRRKSPWLGSFPNSPMSTACAETRARLPAAVDGAPSALARELTPVGRRERIARGVRRLDGDLGLVVLGGETKGRREIEIRTALSRRRLARRV